MDLMMMALPLFALLMLAEATLTSLRGRNVYALKDFGGSMSQLGINIGVRLAIGGALIGTFFSISFEFLRCPRAPGAGC